MYEYFVWKKCKELHEEYIKCKPAYFFLQYIVPMVNTNYLDEKSILWSAGCEQEDNWGCFKIIVIDIIDGFDISDDWHVSLFSQTLGTRASLHNMCTNASSH